MIQHILNVCEEGAFSGCSRGVLFRRCMNVEVIRCTLMQVDVDNVLRVDVDQVDVDNVDQVKEPIKMAQMQIQTMIQHISETDEAICGAVTNILKS